MTLPDVAVAKQCAETMAIFDSFDSLEASEYERASSFNQRDELLCAFKTADD
jgi:hypothetical protein